MWIFVAEASHFMSYDRLILKCSSSSSTNLSYEDWFHNQSSNVHIWFINLRLRRLIYEMWSLNYELRRLISNEAHELRDYTFQIVVWAMRDLIVKCESSNSWATKIDCEIRSSSFYELRRLIVKCVAWTMSYEDWLWNVKLELWAT